MSEPKDKTIGIRVPRWDLKHWEKARAMLSLREGRNVSMSEIIRSQMGEWASNTIARGK